MTATDGKRLRTDCHIREVASAVQSRKKGSVLCLLTKQRQPLLAAERDGPLASAVEADTGTDETRPGGGHSPESQECKMTVLQHRCLCRQMACRLWLVWWRRRAGLDCRN